MARKIQFKRGLKANLPKLSPAELAFTTDEKKAYIGDGNENIKLLDQKDKIEITSQLAEKATKQDIQQLSLSFKESYPTLTALQAAYPNGDTSNHPVIADSYMIYTYKNGWVSTGIQANGTGVPERTITKSKTDFINKTANLFDKTVIREGYSVAATGTYDTLVENPPTNVSGVLYVKPSTSYRINSALTGAGASMRAFLSNGNYNATLTAVNNGDGTYTITTGSLHHILRFTYSPAIMNINNFMMVEGTTIPNKYVPYGWKLEDELLKETTDTLSAITKQVENGSIVKDKSITKQKTDFIHKSPNLFDKTGIIQNKQVAGAGNDMHTLVDANNPLIWVAPIMKVKPLTTYKINSKTTDAGASFVGYKSDGSYSRGIAGVDNGDGTYSITTTAGVEYARFNYSSVVFNPDTVMIVEGNSLPEEYVEFGDFIDTSLIKPAINRIEVLEYETGIGDKPTNYKGDDICIFKKGIAIGDSMTQGTFNTKTGEYILNSDYSYPAKLTQLTGIPITNLGDGGITLKRWYERNRTKDWTGNDFAIVQIGINDVIQGISLSEVETYLNLIIEKLKTDNVGIKIFISTIIPASSYTGSGYDAMTNFIRSYVVGKENIYLTDLAKHGHTKDEEAFNNGHLSAYGYLKLALDYKAYISYIISNNKLDFRNVQFIGTEYTY